MPLPEPEAAGHREIPVEHSDAIPIEPARNVKRRARLLHGLQRISSSPSLAPQLGLNRAPGNPSRARALSSVSLSSPTSPRSYGNSYSSQSSGEGYSTAPTSASSTPGPDTPVFDGSDDQTAIRKVEGAVALGISTPTGALPPDVRPMSGEALSPSEPSGMPEVLKDRFSALLAVVKPARRANINFWNEMPQEIRLSIFSHLTPKQLVRASIVCRRFHDICFDGQLWTSLDASEFYRDIPAASLARIIIAAGPFVRDLNLRGCIQVEHYKRAEVIVRSCRNLINATLEGCRNFQRSTLHSLLRTNQSLASLNLTGLSAVDNSTCKLIAESCPSLEIFNVSWCIHVDARGIQAVILGCPNLRDLRAGEVLGFNNLEVAQTIFETNNLERLLLSGCPHFPDEALNIMIVGKNPEIDVLTNLPVVPVRKLRHLDLSRCQQLTSLGIKSLAHFVPNLEGLRLTGCNALTDIALCDLLATTPRLTHLDLEAVPHLTNSFFSDHLAKAPCAPFLEHLSISYCDNVGDPGVLPVIRACTSLKSVEMDNTRITDLVLSEAAAMVRTRCQRTSDRLSRPRITLRVVAFDCMNVTWTGVSEVLARNAEIMQPSDLGEVTYPVEVIALKCFYGWQMTVDEHLRRVLKGDLPGASRLGRKWRDYMMAHEEVGYAGAGFRRRRRRAREAQMVHADEEEGGIGMGIGRRGRIRANGCLIM